MQFKYSERHLKVNLILGMVQIGIGVISMLIDSMGLFFQYGWILIGAFTLLLNYSERKGPYLILQNDTLLTRYLFGYKKTRISEFTEIEKKNDVLILKYDKGKKKIWVRQAEKHTSERLYAGINEIIYNGLQTV